MILKFVIPSEPIPAARPRFGNGRAYQPTRNRNFRAIVQAAAVEAMHGASPIKGEVTARINLYRRFKPTSRQFGDVDNHVKGIFDALNGICFCDDAQITELVVRKFQDAQNPRAEIELTARGEEDEVDDMPRVAETNHRP